MLLYIVYKWSVFIIDGCGVGCILIQEEEGRDALSGHWMDRVEVSTRVFTFREGSYKGG